MSDNVNNDNTIRACLLFLSFVAMVAGLYFTRNIMAPFALAIFFWLIIDAFARWMDRQSKYIPYWLALTLAVLIVILSLVGILVILAETAYDVSRQAPAYEQKLSGLTASISDFLSRFTGEETLSWQVAMEKFNLGSWIQRILAAVAASVQSVSANLMMITLYVAFLFVAQSTFPKKMDDLFPDVNRRHQAAKVGERIRHSIETYLGVQTVISILQTVLSYIVMVWLGLDNALFWALVIFIMNYIPIIGGVVAWLIPPVFALVQLGTGPAALMLALLFTIQTAISNTLQPKMMGDSMNLSAIVVILSITLWGSLWGGVGAFLSAPLTVIVMIILAQFKTTRWIAVLLSADGQPDLDPEEKIKAGSVPSL